MKKTTLIISFGALTILQGCIAAAVVGGAEAARTVAQERSVGDRIDDNGIALRINDAFLQKDVDNLYTDISTTIFEGRVMLTGSVATEELRGKAEQLVWPIPGVVEVINEVQVAPNSLAGYSKDVYLANAVRSKLLLTKRIKSSNFATSAVNGEIYILGVAQNEEERSNVVEVARRINGVKKVVSHIITVDDERRAKWADLQDK
jgi:osmotically-inducible protein OsmY